MSSSRKPPVHTTPYNEYLIAEVSTFDDLRRALDEAEYRMHDLAKKVDAIPGTIKTCVDISDPFSRMDRARGAIRFRWSMQGLRSPEDIIDEALRRRFGGDGQRPTD